MVAICAPFLLFLRAMAIWASVFLIKGQSSSSLCTFLRGGHFALILRIYPDSSSSQSSPDPLQPPGQRPKRSIPLHTDRFCLLNVHLFLLNFL